MKNLKISTELASAVESQSLLFIQYESMRTYGSCLVSRMKLIIREGINGKSRIKFWSKSSK